MSDCEKNVHVVRSLLKALKEGEVGDSLRDFYAEDVLQIELPNRLNPHGQESGLERIVQRSLQGAQILREQNFEITSEIAQNDWVAVEARWTGVLATAVGTLAAGAKMHASLAMFFRFRDGRIALQRNYDCFEPW